MEGLLNIALIFAVALIIYKIIKSTLDAMWKTLYVLFLLFILGLVSAIILQGVSYTQVIDSLKEPVKMSIDGLKALLGMVKTVNPEEGAVQTKSFIQKAIETIINIIKIFFGGGS